MKKILFLILIFTILMTGCSSGKYYIYQTESKIDLQPTKDNFLPYMYVPKGKHIVIKESRSTVKKPNMEVIKDIFVELIIYQTLYKYPLKI